MRFLAQKSRLSAIVLMAALMATALPILGSKPIQAAPLDTVRERGLLTVVVYRDYPPFSYRQGSKVVGVDADIAREIGKRMDLDVSLIELTADENVDDDLRNGVWKGSVVGGPVGDLMMHVPYDRQLDIRNELAVLFGSYFQETLAVARRRPAMTLSELSEDAIGVELDSISDLYLSGAYGGGFRDSMHRYLTYREAAKALESGEISAIMGTRGELEGALQGFDAPPPISTPGLPGLTMRSWPLGMAVKSDSRDLAYAVGDVVQAMMEDGTLAAIFANHGLTYQEPN